MADTETVNHGISGRLRLALLLSFTTSLFVSFATLLFVGAAVPRTASADPRPLAASVLTVLGDRVYVAADSGAIASGDRLAFAEGDHLRATGRVDGLLDGRIASVKLESGTLTGVKKLAKLRVTAEAAEPARFALLRVGIPAGARRSRVAACAACTVAAPPGWSSERLGPSAWRAVHAASAETLEVRLFRDADDESIAWERGDVDVAVFWPEELSASQIARFAKRDLVVGVRTNGLDVLADPQATGDATTSEIAELPRRDCPMLVRAASRAAVDRLGAGVFADLPACVR